MNAASSEDGPPWYRLCDADSDKVQLLLALQNSSFPVKIYRLLESELFTQLIRWTPEGDAVVITDIELFTQHVLRRYFRHNHFESFTRLLNLYGFRRQILKSSDRRLLLHQFSSSSSPVASSSVLDVVELGDQRSISASSSAGGDAEAASAEDKKHGCLVYNPLFKRGREDLLLTIQRKETKYKRSSLGEAIGVLGTCEPQRLCVDSEMRSPPSLPSSDNRRTSRSKAAFLAPCEPSLKPESSYYYQPPLPLASANGDPHKPLSYAREDPFAMDPGLAQLPMIFPEANKRFQSTSCITNPNFHSVPSNASSGMKADNLPDVLLSRQHYLLEILDRQRLDMSNSLSHTQRLMHQRLHMLSSLLDTSSRLQVSRKDKQACSLDFVIEDPRFNHWSMEYKECESVCRLLDRWMEHHATRRAGVLQGVPHG